MKNIAILGSTGSIGRNTLEVIRNFPGKLRAVALSANCNAGVLYAQIKEFNPGLVCLKEESAALKLEPRLKSTTLFFKGQRGLEEMVQDRRIDKVVLAITGSAALTVLLKAIESGKEVALANKEALVMAGNIIMRKASRSKAKIIPIDSEQSAIWQCLKNENGKKVRKIYLTASGGPFRGKSRQELKKISVKEALRHPKWRMGPKISVDSADLMNKGLEVLEAMHLFGVEAEKIKVLIHPQSIIHSMVEFEDGVILAQLSITDMRIPIQYALTYPERLDNGLAGVDFCEIGRLDFEEPDLRKFPCLGLAYRAAKESGTLPAVLNAANEICVEAFLSGVIKFVAIPGIIEKIMDSHKVILQPELDEILRADSWARGEACRAVNN
ncbi:MAG: 1-deoxy-D-xylulose-5-phosphate reductoisomerase [Candidatus Omnitrophica bacterium]|nr:1-deoxy-D-xylulose-5-phosphate reductoisomerase [Candidatus Omnitrophota bacterium]MDD5553607.1 1-deoxy-D-xylulose-5-phosphate reductoisomerase [Candidatus Omnitrophota bacterium]